MAKASNNKRVLPSLTPDTCTFLLGMMKAMMFMAGANSIFTGDRLLTTSNPEFDADKVMLARRFCCAWCLCRAFNSLYAVTALVDLSHEGMLLKARDGNAGATALVVCSVALCRLCCAPWLGFLLFFEQYLRCLPSPLLMRFRGVVLSFLMYF